MLYEVITGTLFAAVNGGAREGDVPRAEARKALKPPAKLDAVGGDGVGGLPQEQGGLRQVRGNKVGPRDVAPHGLHERIVEKTVEPPVVAYYRVGEDKPPVVPDSLV